MDTSRSDGDGADGRPAHAGGADRSVYRPRVFVVGGGFGGLAAAKALAGVPVDLTVLDRRNHHVFQPLLYQVATASLSPADISSPIRAILRGQENCEVALVDVDAVDLAGQRLRLAGGSVHYDYLVLAVGATHSYFGHEDWAPLAPGLKTLEDATELRRRILLAFEAAEFEGDADARSAALTFGIVGGGPTGVELAGAVMEIAGKTIPRDFKHIDTRTTRVILFEGMNRLLPSFPEKLSERAKRDLERMGVEVRLGSIVSNVTAEGIHLGDELIPVRNVFWAAGVKASPLGATLGVPLDRAGRVIVGPDLTVPGHPEVFVIGDLAAAKSTDTGQPVPGVAQGAIQMGRYAGEQIAAAVDGERASAVRPGFVYHDKGSLAVIGKAKAVAEVRPLRVGGLFAWLLWAVVHIAFLVGFRNRIQVLMRWFWGWVVNARDARLITGDVELRLRAPVPADFARDARLPAALERRRHVAGKTGDGVGTPPPR